LVTRRYHNARERGAALLLFVLLVTAGSSLIALGLGATVYTDIVAALRLRDTKQNILVADSGIEDAVYRLRAGRRTSDEETLALFQATTTTSIATISGGVAVRANATSSAEHTRRREAMLAPGGSGSAGGGASFSNGVQAGAGGIILSNAATVTGNAYSNGPLTGSNFMRIEGNAVSAGPAGRIAGAEVTGAAYAHTIENAIVGGDAYYQSIAGTSVGGASHPGSADRPLLSAAISDETIAAIKATAEAGGTLDCSTYTISSQEVTLGPQRINCDLSIGGSSIVTLAGAVWVSGSITVSGSAVVRLSAALGSASGVMVADNENDRASGSRITLLNDSRFIGDPDSGAYVVFLSGNNSSESGGSVKAIVASNDARGDAVLYAPHGEVALSNDVEFATVAAHTVRGSNNAGVRYSSGLAGLFFGGASGGAGAGAGAVEYRIASWEDVE